MRNILEYVVGLAILVAVFAAANFLMGGKITIVKTTTTTAGQQCIGQEENSKK